MESVASFQACAAGLRFIAETKGWLFSLRAELGYRRLPLGTKNFELLSGRCRFDRHTGKGSHSLVLGNGI